MAVQSGVYRGVPAERRRAERRERLMEATLEVWADAERRTTMTAVCAEAGLSERYFYESFTDLDQALRAVLDATAEEIERTSTAASEALVLERSISSAVASRTARSAASRSAKLS